MFEIIGKAFYTVNYNGNSYNKVRYTLKLLGDKVKHYTDVEGVLTETVCLSVREDTIRPNIGDHVVVSYDVYNGVKKANGIFII